MERTTVLRLTSLSDSESIWWPLVEQAGIASGEMVVSYVANDLWVKDIDD